VSPPYPNKATAYSQGVAYYCDLNQFCGPDKKCHTPPGLGEGCIDIGGATKKCQDGLYCDGNRDSKCHAFAKLGDDCSVDTCGEGRCSPGFLDGQCVTPP
jgi:hypothetical protein